MNFYGIESCSYGSLRGFAVFFYDDFHFFLGQRTRFLAAILGWNVGRGYRLYSGTSGRCGGTGMVDLNGNHAAFVMDGIGKLVKSRHEAVVVDTDLAGAVGSGREIHVCVLDDDQTRAAFGSESVVIDVLIAHLAVRFTVVGSHRGHYNSVLESSTVYGNRFENVWIILLHCISSLTGSVHPV